MNKQSNVFKKKVFKKFSTLALSLNIFLLMKEVKSVGNLFKLN